MNVYPETRPVKIKHMANTMKRIQTAAFGVPEYEVKPQANYRPRISAEHLCRLWIIKHETKKPITKLVAEALEIYFEKQERG